jgi:hypothetical protein
MRTLLNQLIFSSLVAVSALAPSGRAMAQVTANPDFRDVVIGNQVIFSPLANDLGATTIAPVAGPVHGSVTPLPGFQLRYRPDAGFFGLDSLRYRACNGGGLCDEANVYFRVDVDPANVINAHTYEDILLPLYPDDFGFDDDDFDDLGSVTFLLSPVNGSVALDDDEYLEYQPNSGFTGLDSFMVEICLEGPPCQVFFVQIEVTDSCNSDICVLPGDTNRDGVVNQDDLIGIGWSFGLTGFPRPGASIVFNEQPAADWRTDFGGANSKYGDTDGDGVVTLADTTALLANYDLVAARKLYNPQGLSTTPVPAKLQIISDTLLYGDTVLMRISIGTLAKPGVNLYGFSASLSYNFPLTSSARRAVFDFSNSWIATPSENRLTLGKIDTIARTVDFALSRTDRFGVTGFGEVITIKLITEDNIGERPGFQGEPFEVSLNEGILHHADRTQFALAAMQQSALLFVPGPAAPVAHAAQLDRFRIFPNPTTGGQSWILESNRGIASVRVLDMAGRTQALFAGDGAFQLIVPTGRLDRGLYLLEVTESNGRTLHERVSVQ